MSLNTRSLILSVDELLEVIIDEDISWFQKFKEYPGSSTISSIQDYLKRYDKLQSIKLSNVNLSSVNPELAHYFYQLAKYYDAYKIKRFKPEKRYSLMLLFLVESKKVMMDYLIQMHDQYVSNICRECRNAHMKKLKLYKNKNERAITQIEHFIDFVLSQEDDHDIPIRELYLRSTQKSDLQQARDDMHEYKVLSQLGYAKLVQNRYSSMRRYFSKFVQLPFLVEKGNQALKTSIDLIRDLDDQKITKIPDDVDTSFMDRQLALVAYDHNGIIKRNLWEMGVAIAIKDGFRSGDLYVEESNKYASFWSLIYQE